MKEHIVGLAVVGLAALWTLTVCTTATATKTAPEWYWDMNTVYPQERFIAYQGRGKTRTQAEQAALGVIAGYFESEITAVQKTSARWINGQEERMSEASTIVASQVNLIAVRYADDAWNDTVHNEYVSVAYINREEAWDAYYPRAKNGADALLILFQKAEEEADPFTRALRLSGIEQYAAGAEFSAVRGFAQILYPARAAALFRDADAAHARLPERIAHARLNARVYLDCPLDLDDLIHNAVAAAFGSAGFPVANERQDAVAVCEIRVNEGVQEHDFGFIFVLK